MNADLIKKVFKSGSPETCATLIMEFQVMREHARNNSLTDWKASLDCLHISNLFKKDYEDKTNAKLTTQEILDCHTMMCKALQKYLNHEPIDLTN